MSARAGAVLLGVDIGTSACKVAAFTPDGVELASASVAYPVLHPSPGHAEQEPERWLAAAFAGIREVLAGGRVSAAQVAAIGVDGQSWSCIPVDGDGEVLARTPIWMDTRAAEICARVEASVGAAAILALSGNPFKPSYTTPKIVWFRENRPDVYARTRYFLQSNSYVVHGLTGVFSQDQSQCYGLHVVDIATGRYDEAMGAELGIDLDKLPGIVACHEVVGHVTAHAAARTGLLAGTPVVAGGLDAACGALGAGVHRPGQTQEQGGQAGGMSIVVDRPVIDERLILSRHVVPDRFLLQGGTAAGGASPRWIVGQVGQVEQTAADADGTSVFEKVSELAATVPVGSDGVVFLPYLAGERSPVWDATATGVLVGLTLSTTRAHLYRAVMEGVAFSLHHNLQVAESLGVPVGDMSATGGAATSHVWTQIKADVTGKTIHVPAAENATTLGAAMLAGLGAGVYTDAADAVAQTTHVHRTHRPVLAHHARYDAQFGIYREVYDQLRATMATAASLPRPIDSHDETGEHR